MGAGEGYNLDGIRLGREEKVAMVICPRGMRVRALRPHAKENRMRCHAASRFDLASEKKMGPVAVIISKRKLLFLSRL